MYIPKAVATNKVPNNKKKIKNICESGFCKGMLPYPIYIVEFMINEGRKGGGGGGRGRKNQWWERGWRSRSNPDMASLPGVA